MSDKMLKNLKELTESIRLNTAIVKKDMARSGTPEPDTAIVSSAAKYRRALQLLAKE